MVQDYQDFADVNSFQDRVDLHHIVLSDVQAGTYYVAVYNNDAYFKVSSRIREAIGRISAAIFAFKLVSASLCSSVA